MFQNHRTNDLLGERFANAATQAKAAFSHSCEADIKIIEIIREDDDIQGEITLFTPEFQEFIAEIKRELPQIASVKPCDEHGRYMSIIHSDRWRFVMLSTEPLY